ncbi:MAG: hypothetical protein LBD09_05910 [Treponema sp.]|jgi:hypothetical protein|nr:hypothetical protein [Treponema sp.]
MKKRFAVLRAAWVMIFVLAGFVSLEAATVSVLVIETGLPSGAGRTESASVWESGFMDACFDAGHIVSNAPSMRIPRVSAEEFPPEAQGDFDRARLGGADYLIVVFLNYPDGADAKTPGRVHPRDVFIKVFHVSSGDLVYKMPVKVEFRSSLDEEFMDAKRNAGRVVFRLALKG